jgi:AcrR family transcriptional regulator
MPPVLILGSSVKPCVFAQVVWGLTAVGTTVHERCEVERTDGSVSADPAGGLRERQKNSIRSELRAAALELFDRQGFAATTVDEIARRAAVSRSTFFRYVGSKEALMAGETGDQAALFLGLLKDRPSSESRMQALEAALIELTTTLRSDERREEMLLIDRIIDSDPSLNAARAATTAHWVQEVAKVLALRDGRDAPDLEDALAAAILSQITEHVGTRWRLDADPQPVEELISSHFASVRRLATS